MGRDSGVGRRLTVTAGTVAAILASVVVLKVGFAWTFHDPQIGLHVTLTALFAFLAGWLVTLVATDHADRRMSGVTVVALAMIIVGEVLLWVGAA